MATISREFGHHDLSLKIFGKDVFGCTSVQYKDEDPKEFLFANSALAKSYHRKGQKQGSGSLELLQSEYLEFVSGFDAGKNFTDAAPSDVIVTYKAESSTNTYSVVFKNVLFNDRDLSSKSGDSTLAKISFIYTHCIETAI